MNKRGSLLPENIIFIILNLVFFAIMLTFIVSNINGRPTYEEAYAKQIALIIDEAKPNTSILIDMEDLIKIAKKNKIDINKTITIDKKQKKVIVKLGEKGGHSYKYFSNTNISSQFQSGGYFLIKIKEKENAE